MSDPARLAAYVNVWWQSIGDLLDVLGEVPTDQWALPTDLPGWTVHDVLAHVAHVEHVAAGGAHVSPAGIEIGSPEHVRNLLAVYTEQGVVARRGAPPADLIAAIRHDTEQRYRHLTTSEIVAEQTADGPFGAMGWTWEVLLRNRPVDVWMHEQDIRRAIGAPGGMNSAPAQHAADVLTASFPVVLGKRVAPPPGTSAVLAVDGSPEITVEIGADGRARLGDPADPTVRLEFGREAFVLAAGGRRRPGPDGVRVIGDAALGAAIVDQLAVMP